MTSAVYLTSNSRRASLRIRDRRPRKNRSTASARAAGSPGRKRNPVRPSSISREMLPRSLPMTGSPLAKASITVRVHPSYQREGKTRTSASRMRESISAGGRRPSHSTPGIFRRAKGPSPTIFRGRRPASRSQACSRVSIPFSGDNRPTKRAKPPPPVPAPGSGKTKFGLTAIRSGGRPPWMNLRRLNSVPAM